MSYLSVYGASDDLVEFDGVFREEYGAPGVFMIRIVTNDGEARFTVAAKFCSVGWRLTLETWTGASELATVEVEFTHREGRDDDPMIVFHFADDVYVEVIEL